MSELFLTVLNMSITASWLIGAVLLLRLLLKKAPKWISVLLWGLASVRLLLPFSLESAFSLLPETQWVERPAAVQNDSLDDIPFTPDVITATDLGENVTVTYVENEVTLEIHESPDPIGIFTYLWAAGVVLMLLYALLSTANLRRKTATAVLLRDRIYRTECSAAPFVLGILRPKIFVPFDVDEDSLTHILAHEEAHLRRLDHLWKPLGFVVLAVHWFNPLVWLGYLLLCRDIESACDEKVIRTLTDEERANYSEALLRCSIPQHSQSRRLISACPLAFGEVSVKDRVKNVLSYKKPALWILLAAILLCGITAVCFLTNPSTPTEMGDDTPAVTNWRPLEELYQNYSPAQAEKDGCVVLDGQNVVSGEEIWKEFVKKTDAKEPSAVRLYQNYSEQFVYYLFELQFNGSTYHLRFYDWTGDTNELFFSEEEYRYLIPSVHKVNGNSYQYYLLADSPNVTADGYWSALLSSVFRPEYDIYNHCRPIYSVALTKAPDASAPNADTILHFTKDTVISELSFDAPDSVLDFVALMANNLNGAMEGNTVTEAVLTDLEALPIDRTHFPEPIDFYRIGFKLVGTSVNTDDVVVFTEKDMESSYLLVYDSFDNSTGGHSMLIIADRTMEESYNTEEMLEHYGNKYTAAAVCELRRMYPNLFPDPIP